MLFELPGISLEHLDHSKVEIQILRRLKSRYFVSVWMKLQSFAMISLFDVLFICCSRNPKDFVIVRREDR